MDEMHQPDYGGSGQRSCDRSQQEKSRFLQDGNSLEDHDDGPSYVADVDRFVGSVENQNPSAQLACRGNGNGFAFDSWFCNAHNKKIRHICGGCQFFMKSYLENERDWFS